LLARLKQTLPKCNQNSITCILVDENGYVLLNGEVAPREEYVFLSEIHAGLAQNAIQKEILVRDSCVEYGEGQRRYTYKMSRKGASGIPGGRSGSENGVSLKCGQYTVREVPDTNLFIFVLTDTCDAGWSDCKPCTVENCREAVAKDTLKQVCMPCNCHMFHDTCSLKYTAGGGISNTGTDQDACPSAPPGFVHSTVGNVCATTTAEPEDTVARTTEVYDRSESRKFSIILCLLFLIY